MADRNWHPTNLKQMAEAKKRRRAMQEMRDKMTPDGKHKYSLEAIGKKFGNISRERVRQILAIEEKHPWSKA